MARDEVTCMTETGNVDMAFVLIVVGRKVETVLGGD